MRALLCVCPPYPMVSPPAGAAALLGYLKAHGIADFGFLDLRLGTPSCHEATYSATGVFGESFVMDVPDLPLVLQLLGAAEPSFDASPYRARASRRPYEVTIDDLIERYCLERGISPNYLGSYLKALNRYYEKAFERDPLPLRGSPPQEGENKGVPLLRGTAAARRASPIGRSINRRRQRGTHTGL